MQIIDEQLQEIEDLSSLYDCYYKFTKSIANQCQSGIHRSALARFSTAV